MSATSRAGVSPVRCVDRAHALFLPFLQDNVLYVPRDAERSGAQRCLRVSLRRFLHDVRIDGIAKDLVRSRRGSSRSAFQRSYDHGYP